MEIAKAMFAKFLIEQRKANDDAGVAMRGNGNA
jgi:hypothetical protein